MPLTDRTKQILSWYASDNPGTKANLARMLCKRANIESARGQRDDALVIYGKACGLQERLIDEEPVNLWFQQDLATTYRQLGGQLCVQHKYDEALATLERSQALLQRLVPAARVVRG